MIHNSHLLLLEVWFIPAATPRATVTTGGLNQARVSGVVCDSTPGTSDSRTSHLHPLKKSYGGGDSNPPAVARRSQNTRSKTQTKTIPPILIPLTIPSRLLGNRLERRTALVARELARYKVDIAALSETRFSEQGQLEEVFFWSGRPKAERCEAGVAFAIWNDIVGHLPCLPQGINDRLMSHRLTLRGDKFTTIISAYAPPMTSSDTAKEKFYEDLHALLATVSNSDQLIVINDFNTRVRTDHAVWQGGLCPHGLGGAMAKGYADRNEMKNFFKAIKAIYGPCIKGSAPLLSSDGTTLLTGKSQILKRWAEHFRNVLNCSSAISDAATDRLPQVDTNNDLDLPPSLPETIRAVQQISSGKAPGSDAIPPKVFKHGGPRLMAELTTLFQEMWRQGKFLRISKTRPSSITTTGRGTGNSVINTEASRCSTSPGRSSHASFSIVLTVT
ncbi:unnamed protein product [Schistocephalus solidus]|uniref:Endo/exonuclease/phosphatase domain-containing protein n=1 Tax=Schistocephalus solidus TaxID=70667 RepID=A0A183TCH9_SCHSO|nr:unnamed protein product [Schistocephalus solidus]